MRDRNLCPVSQRDRACRDLLYVFHINQIRPVRAQETLVNLQLRTQLIHASAALIDLSAVHVKDQRPSVHLAVHEPVEIDPELLKKVDELLECAKAELL